MADRVLWTYWEGPMPPYIALCVRTLRSWHPDVRLLDGVTFDELFTSDRHLNIGALAVNHRSDFVRAYLLFQYGGLYVDADCIALRPFDPLFEAAERHGFAGYREPDGYVSCNLMASKAGGAVISDHYRRVHQAVERGQPLAWLDLASMPMEQAVAAHPGHSQLLPREFIMPISWRDSEQLCRRGQDNDHLASLHPNAFCVMLSNNTIKSGRFSRILSYLPEEVLLRDRSLVSALFRFAFRLPSPPVHEVPPHLGGHEGITQLDEGAFDYLVTRYDVRSMLDVGCGTGGMLYYARTKGIRAVGIDGDPNVAHDSPDILEHDYGKGPLEVGEFDLGWAVEFVEHVDEQFIANYMVTFRCCKHVFITAAVPGQPGHHHVNCQHSDYWITRFREAGFELDQDATEQARLRSNMWSRFTQQTGLVFQRDW